MQTGSIGAIHGSYFLCIIVILLLIRQVYLTATVSKVSHQDEAEWYPLAALTELIAVCLFAVPGLVPNKRDLTARINEHEKNPEGTELA